MPCSCNARDKRLLICPSLIFCTITNAHHGTGTSLLEGMVPLPRISWAFFCRKKREFSMVRKLPHRPRMSLPLPWQPQDFACALQRQFMHRKNSTTDRASQHYYCSLMNNASGISLLCQACTTKITCSQQCRYLQPVMLAPSIPSRSATQCSNPTRTAVNCSGHLHSVSTTMLPASVNEKKPETLCNHFCSMYTWNSDERHKKDAIKPDAFLVQTSYIEHLAMLNAWCIAALRQEGGTNDSTASVGTMVTSMTGLVQTQMKVGHVLNKFSL